MICPLSCVGMNPVGTILKSTTVPTRTASENISEANRRSITQFRLDSYFASTRSYTRSEALNNRPCWCDGGFRNRLASIGVSVSDTKPDTRIAVPMVTANS